MKEGKIYLDSKDVYQRSTEHFFVLDVEPAVMTKIRGLFPKSRFRQESGEYSHKPLIVYRSDEACRDIKWILDRFELGVSDEASDLIQNGSFRFDNLKKEIEKVFDYSNIVEQEDEDFVPIQNVEKRDYQVAVGTFSQNINPNFLLADEMGLGKTVEAGILLQFGEWRKSVIVMPVSITRQWYRAIQKMFPSFKVYITKTGKCTIPDDTDIVLTNYSKLSALQEELIRINPRSVIFDEVQELRRSSSDKYSAAKKLVLGRKSMGLSGTPIYNMGAEVFSVLDVLNQGCLGSKIQFVDEWCELEKVKHPELLHKHLTTRGLMVRRTAKEVGIYKPIPKIDIVEIDSDLDSLKAMEDVAKKLALSVIGADVIRRAEAAREFNVKLRQATGVAKAKSCAEFVANMVQNGEKVLLTGWHREFWDIVTAHFDKKGISYKMITGHETTNQKDKSLLAMSDGEVDVICISLRSGAGLDGLQNHCRVVVFGELDWSKNAMKQMIDRIARPGQEGQVLVYFLTINDGSDPFIMNLINVKDGQFKGIIEGKSDSDASVIEESQSLDQDIAVSMATKYLESIGVDANVSMSYSPEVDELKSLIERSVLPNSTEEVMQIALNDILQKNLENWTIHREYRYSKRSRLDFLAEHRNGVKVVIECKNNNRDRAEVYRQIRRYIEETGVKDIILVGPWNGIKSFELDGANVIICDTTKARLKS